MMIEVENAVVTDVTVSSALGSEDHACLAKLESVELWTLTA